MKALASPIESSASDAKALLSRARDCLGTAYAPYSQFQVAAAVLDHAGRIFTGVNIENASYSLTICAERVAIFSAVAAGARRIRALAVTSRNIKPVTPCGACRQVISEFCDPETPVYGDTGAEDPVIWTVRFLLPIAFSASDLGVPKRVP